jgi:hypothetical protein
MSSSRVLVLGAFALGGVFAYFFDPRSGLQRRVMVRERLGRARETLQRSPNGPGLPEAEFRDSLF